MPHNENRTTELYRPSNGSEGEWFMSQWCDRCVKDTPSRPCRILGRTMVFDTRDKEYPHEWVHDAGQWPGNPRCTAFSDHVPAPLTIIRDKRQGALL